MTEVNVSSYKFSSLNYLGGGIKKIAPQRFDISKYCKRKEYLKIKLLISKS